MVSSQSRGASVALPSGVSELGTSLLLAASFWMIVAGGQPHRIVAALFILWVIGGLGLRIISVGGLVQERETEWLWRLGPGVLMGVFVLFVVRSFSTRPLFLALIIALGCIEILLVFKSAVKIWSQSQGLSWTGRRSIELAQNTCWMAAVLGVGLFRTWNWILPIVISLLLCGFSLRIKARSLLHRVVLSAGVLVSTVALAGLAFSLRAQLWWMDRDDNQWFEAISFSLVHRGPAIDSISSARNGASAAAYHHLAFFLTGLIDLGVRGTTYQTLTRYTPVILALITVASGVVFLVSAQQSVTSRVKLSTLAAVGYVLLIVPITVAEFSNYLGLAAMISSAAIIYVFSRTSDKWSSAIVLGLMIPVTAFSKATSLYGPLLLVTALVLFSVRRRLKTALAVLITTLTVVWFLRSASPASGDFRITLFYTDSIGELSQGSMFWQFVSLFVVLAPLIPGFVLGAWLLSQENSSEIRSLVYGLFAVMAAGYASRFLIGGRIETIRYLWEPATVASALLVALAVVKLWRQPLIIRRPPTAVIASSAVFVVVLAISQILPDLNSGSAVAKLLRIWSRPSFILFVAVVVVALISLFMRKGNGLRVGSNRWNVVLLTSLIPFVVAVDALPGFAERYREARNGATDAGREPWLGSKDVIEVSHFLRDSTPSESLVAVTLCEYLTQDCTTDYSLAAYSRRRFLSLGGDFVLYWPLDELTVADSKNSVLSGSNSITEVISYWHSRGANYGVIDKTYLAIGDVDAVRLLEEEILFENNRYQVLQLER